MIVKALQKFVKSNVSYVVVINMTLIAMGFHGVSLRRVVKGGPRVAWAPRFLELQK